MSGHSKWSTIKHKKGKLDAKRGKIFTKIGKEIMVAVKIGGPDPEGNSRLKLALTKAKANNLPNDNVKRLIQKASKEDTSTNYFELMYEGYGPGGAAVIVEALTDNKNRTAGEVRHIFDKCGGNLGESGCVAWMFDHKGIIQIPLGEQDADELTMLAIEAGADDVEVDGEELIIYTQIGDLEKVRGALDSQGMNISVAELTRVPNNNIEITDLAKAKQLVKMMDLLEDNDDIQNTYSNFDFSEEIGAAL